MIKFLILTFFTTLFIFLNSCQTIKQKSDAIVEKENNKLSQYIGKTYNNSKMDLGKPNEDFINEKGNLLVIYNTKKYGIPCERKFEIDATSIIIGFTSNGCF